MKKDTQPHSGIDINLNDAQHEAFLKFLEAELKEIFRGTVKLGDAWTHGSDEAIEGVILAIPAEMAEWAREGKSFGTKKWTIARVLAVQLLEAFEEHFSTETREDGES